VAELATLLGIESITPPQPAFHLESLTASQQAAFREIAALTEIYFAGGLEHGGVKMRIAPLIIGPSGLGKSHLVMTVGRALGLPVLRMTVSDWIVQAARQTPCALAVLQAKLKEHRKFILFIDELDKLSKSHEGGDYTLFQQVEIYGVLDRAVSYAGSPGGSWGSEQDRQLRENVMIVGGGTWHDLWAAGPPRSMGFASGGTTADDITNQIRQARIIPEELLNRFSDRWLLLRPYTVEDFQAIAERIGLTPEEFDPVAAVASGGNFRAVQNALTARALKQYFAAQANAPTNRSSLTPLNS
jgi:SpoVK/Ycf46/Vps4 family AAA+-type ATPase